MENEMGGGRAIEGGEERGGGMEKDMKKGEGEGAGERRVGWGGGGGGRRGRVVRIVENIKHLIFPRFYYLNTVEYTKFDWNHY
jgi:hypothetical protein